jgi:hypothetical protein
MDDVAIATMPALADLRWVALEPAKHRRQIDIGPLSRSPGEITHRATAGPSREICWRIVALIESIPSRYGMLDCIHR